MPGAPTGIFHACTDFSYGDTTFSTANGAIHYTNHYHHRASETIGHTYQGRCNADADARALGAMGNISSI